MLVERRGFLDRHIKAVLFYLDAANGEDELTLFTATRPMRMRVRQLTGHSYSVDPPSTIAWWMLFVVPEGASYGGLDVPTNVASPIKEFFAPQDWVIWTHLSRNSYTGTVNELPVMPFEWWGDGRIISLQEGDSIRCRGDPKTGQITMYFILDLEEVE